MSKYPWTESDEPYESLVAFDDWIESQLAPLVHEDWDEVGPSLRAELYMIFRQVFDATQKGGA